MTNIEKLNADIKKFPQVFPVTSEMNKTFEGVQRLIMLDRYAFKDTKKETLAIGDLVVLTVKQDPNFPARGIGNIVAINDAEVTVRLEEVYHQYAETEDGLLKAPISAVDKPLELYYEQIAKRNAKGLASVEGAEKRKEVEKAFYEQLSDLKFVPAGRVLYGAGADIDVTFFNCFTADTIVQTEDGAIPIGELSGNVSVLSKDGVYREAYFKSYGEQEIYEVEFANGEKIKTTAGHKWWYNTKNGLKETTTIDLEGKNIPVEKKSKKLNKEDLAEGIRHGIVYGDGSLCGNTSRVFLFGEKEKFVKYFEGCHINKHKNGKYVLVSKLPEFYKSLPKENSSESYWHGFIVGLIGTDGYVDNRGSFGFHSSKLEELKEIAKNLYKTNFTFSSIKMSREINPYNDEVSPCYKLQLIKQSATSEDFIKDSHKWNFINSPKSNKKASLKVVSVKSLGYTEEVFCCNEEETHTFVIGSGILTQNCYVMPMPKDSREGIGQHRNEVMEIMSRGGGK